MVIIDEEKKHFLMFSSRTLRQFLTWRLTLKNYVYVNEALKCYIINMGSKRTGFFQN